MAKNDTVRFVSERSGLLHEPGTRLIDLVLYGSPELKVELLEEFGRIRVSSPSQDTSLRDAVVRGNLDSVETLLKTGADPGGRDSEGENAVSIAEKLAGGNPRNSGRMQILNLVRFFFNGSEATRSWGGNQESSGGAEDALVDKKALLQELATKVSQLSKDVRGRLEKTSAEDVNHRTWNVQRADEVFDTIHAELTSLREAFADNTEGLGTDPRDARGKTEERKRIPSSTLDASNADLMKALTSRDQLLASLEVGVTSLVEQWHPLKETLEGLKGRVEEMLESEGRLNEPIRGTLRGVNPYEVARRACIESMMQKTSFLNDETCNESQFREFYGFLLSHDVLTASILFYLQHQPGLKIKVDCGSTNVGRMKERVHNHDRDEHAGFHYRTFEDFEENCVYVGGMLGVDEDEVASVGRLAMSLGRMCNYFLFGNEGKPYKAGDEESGRRYRRILSEALEKRERGDTLGGHFHWALCWKTQLGREVALVSAVPRMVAEHGPVWGTRKLRRHLRSLLDFYEERVLLALHRGTEMSQRYPSVPPASQSDFPLGAIGDEIFISAIQQIMASSHGITT